MASLDAPPNRSRSSTGYEREVWQELRLPFINCAYLGDAAGDVQVKLPGGFIIVADAVHEKPHLW